MWTQRRKQAKQQCTASPSDRDVQSSGAAQANPTHLSLWAALWRMRCPRASPGSHWLQTEPSFAESKSVTVGTCLRAADSRLWEVIDTDLNCYANTLLLVSLLQFSQVVIVANCHAGGQAARFPQDLFTYSGKETGELDSLWPQMFSNRANSVTNPEEGFLSVPSNRSRSFAFSFPALHIPLRVFVTLCWWIQFSKASEQLKGPESHLQSEIGVSLRHGFAAKRNNDEKCIDQSQVCTLRAHPGAELGEGHWKKEETETSSCLEMSKQAVLAQELTEEYLNSTKMLCVDAPSNHTEMKTWILKNIF